MNKNKKDKTEVLSGAPVISWDWNLLQRPERGKCIIMLGHTGTQGEDGLSPSLGIALCFSSPVTSA